MDTKAVDEMVTQLLKKVEDKKKEIGNAERPSWNTNCSFRFDPNSNASINIQVANLETMVSIAGHLTHKYKCYNSGIVNLGLNHKEVPFKYLGFTYEEWMEDFNTRVNGLKIKIKKDELAKLEERVNALVSPEQRRLIELQKLTEELK